MSLPPPSSSKAPRNHHTYQDSVRTSAKDRPRKVTWWQRLWRVMTDALIVLSALWLSAALWYQLNGSLILCAALIASVVILAIAALFSRHASSRQGLRPFSWVYGVVWLLGLAWFVTIPAKSERNWKPEVAHILSYERDANHPDLITFHNVRNFDWYTADLANEQWQTRQVDLSKLSGVSIVNAYWMGPLIAHTLITFEFEDDRPLAFSFEIRKEQDESFSAIGGFFKQYELSLIASEERDIIYTRTNARGEQVYLFPLDHLTQSQVREMFEAYLRAADELKEDPVWYNTLTSNCTNIIFYMARAVTGDALPWDYRVWASGWLPNYLYDIGVLPNTAAAEERLSQDSPQSEQRWTMEEWYQRAHLNPKVASFSRTDNQSLDAYSKLIRQGLPKAELKK